MADMENGTPEVGAGADKKQVTASFPLDLIVLLEDAALNSGIKADKKGNIPLGSLIVTATANAYGFTLTEAQKVQAAGKSDEQRKAEEKIKRDAETAARNARLAELRAKARGQVPA